MARESLARMLGDGLREIAVLIMVFGPAESLWRTLGRDDAQGDAHAMTLDRVAVVFAVALIFWVAGAIVERTREE